MNFKETPEFAKDFKQLQKKFRSLKGDLELFEKVLAEEPLGTGKHFVVLCQNGPLRIVKARLFCLSLAKSSLRIIYAYHEKTNEISLIEFIEMYFKGQQIREDQKRIEDYLKALSSLQ